MKTTVHDVVLIQAPGETAVLEGITVEQVRTGRVLWIQMPEGVSWQEMEMLANRLHDLPLPDPRVVVILPPGARILISRVEDV